ncbi:hypothetical protein SAMN04515668_0918 [Hymenobacter arizonensis]|uniref:Uncharacterized protein n=1 Tax=Hymenobacter arizonensis TaxID=1227077 RepID=A0A1I5UGV2_HYMAR|nr:hypothetical protein SAMN04515668_0918 [Hymenobacter arizonensis]
MLIPTLLFSALFIGSLFALRQRTRRPQLQPVLLPRR